MPRRRVLFLSLAALAHSACASAWQSTYSSAATLSHYVDDVHEHAWSEPLRERAAECAETLPPERTVEDVDGCLGVFARDNAAEVVAALEKYNAAAKVLSAALLAADPEKADAAELIAAWVDVVAAARELVALFPDGAKLLRQLDAVTKVVR